jgi:6-pyruvoyltetrahydropterin/6-carboxytetrahydropterin synthase
MRVSKIFNFDSAHFLPSYHGKCERLHGHTYKLTVTIEGIPDGEGMVLDFLVLKNIVQDNVLSKLDHVLLNDIIEQPTAENIALWIWKTIEPEIMTHGVLLAGIELWETPTSYVSLSKNDRQ